MDWLRSAAELIRCHPVLFPALELLSSHPSIAIIKMSRSPVAYHKFTGFFTNVDEILEKSQKTLDSAGGGDIVWATVESREPVFK